MQQFKPYFTGKADPMKDFGSKNTVSIQKSFRTSDIDEVGDESHLTFFEMLGNFSFGGYFKEKAIEYGYEFITKEMGLKIDYVSVFEGDSEIPADAKSEKIWKLLGVKDIRKFGRKDNFWGPTGAEGPCGPTTEIYVNSALRQAQGKPPVEVWNIVFNEYYQRADKQLEKLNPPGVDTGMGLERLAMVSQNVPTIFETDLFKPLMNVIQLEHGDVRVKRILADHIRGAIYLIADGVVPGNKERGYILRRLLRRVATSVGTESVVPLDQRGQPPKSLNERTYEVIESVKGALITLDDTLRSKEESIESVIRRETDDFIRLLRSGKELEDIIKKYQSIGETKISGRDAFRLHSSLGVPLSYVKDEVRKHHLRVDEDEFEEEKKKHQEISRAGQEKKFGGHGLILDTGELKAGSEEELKKVLRLHTATHLLQQALREVLGNEVGQRGSDITAERTRFDFSFSRKVTPEEIKKVEEIVNQKIKEDLPVGFVEFQKAEAEKVGALHFFSAKGGSASGGKEKYPEKVKVYFVGKTLETAWSKEFCGGPHVTHTGVIGKFRIIKEEAVGAGVRRIRGGVE